MVETSKLYRCIISPGIAEVFSNVKIIPGFFPANFSPHQNLELTSRPAVRINFQVKDLPPRQSYLSLKLGSTHAESWGDTFGREYIVLGPIKAGIQIDGLSGSPTITVNKLYYRLGRLRIDNFCPPGIHLRNILWASLIQGGYQPLFCSAFAASGEGILVVGPPNIGKTLVLLQAIEHGFQYLSDDLIIADSSGHLYACPSVSSFAYELARISEFSRYRGVKLWKSKFLNSLSRRVPLAGALFERPYLDVKLFTQQIEVASEANTHYIFILAKGSNRVERLSTPEVLNMLLTINRFAFSCYEDYLLLEYSLINPRLDLSELMHTEERFLQKLVEGATCFLCVASRPEEYFGLIKQSI